MNIIEVDLFYQFASCILKISFSSFLAVNQKLNFFFKPVVLYYFTLNSNTIKVRTEFITFSGPLHFSVIFY